MSLCGSVKMPAYELYLLLIFLIGTCQTTSAATQSERDIFVMSTSHSTRACPDGYRCLSFLTYLAAPEEALASNTTLHFLPGIHSVKVNNATTIIISNVTNLTLRGTAVDLRPPNALVVCGGSLQFYFTHCTNISIRDLAFSNCGLETISVDNSSLQPFPLPRPCSSPRAALQFYDIDYLSLQNVDVRYSFGYGVFAVNTLRKLFITECNFQRNSGSSRNQYSDVSTSLIHGGTVLIIYHDILLERQLHHSLDVINSTFYESYKLTSDDVILECEDMDYEHSCNFETCSSSGLAIIVIPGYQEQQYMVPVLLSISITRSVFDFNRAYNGGNMMIAFLAKGNSSKIKCMVSIQQCEFLSGEAIYYGGGLYLYHDMVGSSTEIDIYNSTFRFNKARDTGGGLAIRIKQSHTASLQFIFDLAVTLCTFNVNSGHYHGGSVSISEEETFYPHDAIWAALLMRISFLNTTFLDGEADLSGGGMYFRVLRTQSGSGFEIASCTFINNIGKTGAGIAIEKYHCSDSFCINVTVFGSMFDNNCAIDSGGHIALDYAESNMKQNNSSAISIVKCSFHRGKAKEGGAIGVIFRCSPIEQNCSITIILQFSTFINNTAELGGAVSLYCHILRSKPVSVDVHIYHTFFDGNRADFGGGLLLNSTLAASEFTQVSIYIINSNLSNNYARTGGAGLCVFSENKLHKHVVSLIRINLQGTLLTGNIAQSGSAVSILCSMNVLSAMNFTHSQFYNQVTVDHNSAVVYLENVSECHILHSKFKGNFGSCITANQSSLYFQGNVVFTDNKANVGTAIRLDCSPMSLQHSFLNLLPNASLIISNNTAYYYGGGLAVNPMCRYDNFCFFQIPLFYNGSAPHIEIMGNTAVIAGSGFYGKSVDNCTVVEPKSSGHEMFLSMFSLESFLFDQVVMFTQVYTVCFCSKDPRKQLQCSIEVNHSTRPGEEFSLAAIVTRPLEDATTYHFVRASVHAVNNGSAQLGTRQIVQELKTPCQDLTYSVMTSAPKVKIYLTAEYTQWLSPSFIHLTMEQCPLGFTIDNQSKCECSKYLISLVEGISCDINSNAFSVPGEVWIGNTSDDILAAHTHCPFDYCLQVPHSLKLQDPDAQCKFNRSGVLCGGCQHGFSLILGSSACVHKCSNYYLFLVIPFTVAGVFLVVFLLKCNLTVSKGSINALIFYVNIVHVNNTIFLPQNNTIFITKLLATFTAWLNLDLGIETCFYSNMTAYTKTWLQFAFPVYIWSLVIIVICSCRFWKFSYIVGSNAVSVLATLLVLSYAKLLRVVILAVSLISIRDSEGKGTLLWIVNGNVRFLEGPHAALFAMALLVLLVYIIPLTLLTLFAPCMQAWNQHRLLRWVNKLKPLLDAFQGPYKDKYRYWTGIMLLLRTVLFTVFATEFHGDPSVNYFTIALAMLIVFLYQSLRGSPYTNKVNWFLEVFFNLNLGIFSMASLFIKRSKSAVHNQEYLSCIAVGSVFIVSCGILLGHLIIEASASSKLVKVVEKLKYWKPRTPQTSISDDSSQPSTPLSSTNVALSELREPLIEDN